MTLLSMKMLRCSLLSVSFSLSSVFASEEKKNLPRICMILDKGGKNDHSFNESAVNGFNLAKEKLAIDKAKSKFVETRDENQLTQFYRSFATSNCSLIIGIGFIQIPHMLQASAKYPKQKFLLIDAHVEDKHKNIRSAAFREDEGSFLVGAIAAMKTKTNAVGFIGGMDIPIIHRFYTGFEGGAKFIKPKIQVFENYIGVTPESWTNPGKASEIAFAQFQKNVDIVYHGAAASGLGVFDAAEQSNKRDPQSPKKYVIGVDSNQNWIKPGIVLTSMIKKIDTVVFESIKDITVNNFQTGQFTYGLKNNGVDWVVDKHNKHLFSDADIKKIETIKADIIAGKVKVPDYYEITKNQK